MTSGRSREVKNKRKLQTVISKSGHGRLREVVARGGYFCPIEIGCVIFSLSGD